MSVETITKLLAQWADNPPGNTKSISVIGKLVNGTLVDVTEEATFQSNAPDVVAVDEAMGLTAKGEGTAAVDITVTKNNVTKSLPFHGSMFLVRIHIL